MSKTIIKIENISKLYRIGQVGTGTLSHDLNRWWAKVRGKEDPYLKIGSENDRTKKSDSDYSWALKDINFEVKEGEVLGIIGKNGAGKSTLLKLLSRVTSPTTGSIKVKGRIASLLEVGTGFHPELSGRENIYLNGAILGMSRSEIKKKFDEIVQFAGVEKYIDTPVKRYSSGMYVRLAFAVAAHLDSEILILDEVLAVGDAEFQKKCLGKMGDVANNEGRTVIFVSHDLTAVQKLCKSGILLHHGTILKNDDINSVIGKYLITGNSRSSLFNINKPNDDLITFGFIKRVQIENEKSELLEEIPIGDTWQIRVLYSIIKPVPHFLIAIGIQSDLGLPLRTVFSNPQQIEPGEYEAIFRENVITYASGQYRVSIGLSNFERSFHYTDTEVSITVSDTGSLVNDNTYIRTKGVGFILNRGEIKSFDTNTQYGIK